mmetsp:Transcript_16918/g.25593  ORF Transcript_16918/g.25593 Transcript_16918/m.25593 type:complete len:217 (+) Transcript_16918:137-787(+)|eukprot:CAMPEP_0178902216 /NCGR_PEP_ID=MMETSP0786-20121207/4481_1 /TAXON_ID=186022 /ORGANISM="Thalassionema frauenfeldii, Strain CCMP 1798" /LENGTH=216 /DNA_ID=CAMNT_0020573457 /DNA_START=125 /DNA_END=775 /DNA_ORIENTATION=+
MSDLPIYVPEDTTEENKGDGLLYPKEYEGHLQHVMLKREEILACVKSLASKIGKDYAGKFPVMVCALKGANNFYQHLLEALQELRLGYTTEFLRASSYVGSKSSGSVTISGGLDYEKLMGRHVILVEDILETGTTLSHLIPTLREECNVESIEVCSLLQKRLEHPPKQSAKYVGFSIPDHFVIGYGLDYNELYRDLRDIWVISKAGIAFDPTSLFK